MKPARKISVIYAVGLSLLIVGLSSCSLKKNDRVELPDGYKYFIANSHSIGIVDSNTKYVIPPNISDVEVSGQTITGIYSPYKGINPDWAVPGYFEIDIISGKVKFAVRDQI